MARARRKNGVVVGAKVAVGRASRVSMGISVGVEDAREVKAGIGVEGGVTVILLGKLHDAKTNPRMIKTIWRRFIIPPFRGDVNRLVKISQ
jgi:hypothetical protein